MSYDDSQQPEQHASWHGVAAESKALRDDVLRAVTMRWELVRLEGRSAVWTLRRFGVAMLLAYTALVVALPVALVGVCPSIDALCGFRAGVSLWTAVAVLVLAAVVTLWRETRKFQRDFAGLRDTVAEFEEDLHWLREWIERPGRK